MSEDNKLKLGSRGKLGVKKTIEAGQVKQSFSHGRSKSVVVEVKRRRVLKRPEDEAQPEEVVQEAPAPVAEPAPQPPKVEAPAPAPVPVPAPEPEAEPVARETEPAPQVAEPEAARAQQPEPKAPPQARPQPERPAARRGGERPQQRPTPTPIASADRLTRREQQEMLLRRAEEERLQASEEQRRREDEARRRAEEDERQAREAKRQAEEAAAAAAAEEARAQKDGVRTPDDVRHKPARDEKIDDESEERAAKKKSEAPRPVKAARGAERRQSGKLSVTKALDGDESGRVRSLAALRRAREKEKRAHRDQGPVQKQVREVVVPEAITVQELANRMAERGADLVKSLFKMGVAATITQTIDQDTAELLVTEFGHVIKRVSESDVELGVIGEEDTAENLQPRPAVVTVMGHVDHGKTSLLDALRNTDVVSGEAGGITQHIGAYQVGLPSGEKVTFLDTPGHEAFTAMRARGANITDIVILVVAADDGLMPQTIEAINHAKAAGVPMIIAINKMDKPGANPDKVRQALLQHEVIVEEMGGDVLNVEVSALKRTNLDKLVEQLALQAELLELGANPDRAAEGTVIEAKLDKGRGSVATLLIRRGTLRVGDILVAGPEWGKVRALINDRGEQVKSAGPSQPVEVLGLNAVPGAGDDFAVVDSEARAREISSYRQGLIQKKRQATAPTSLETMFSALKEKKAAEFPVVVKGDVQGSVEAIVQALNRLSTEDIKVRVLHDGVGAITESDISLAKASNALIIGFNVRANAKAREVAEAEGVGLKYYSIIYDLVDEVKAAMAGQLGPEIIEKVSGRADVREVFTAGKAGKAAGCLVTEGVIRRNLKARLMRDDVIVYDGQLSSLRRFKDDVNEVRTGLECGMTLENFQDIKAGDVIEAYELEERERVL